MQSLVLCELSKTRFENLESYSPFCLKAHRALKVARLPYVSRHGDRPDAFKHLNPSGQVPVLLVENDAVADSTRILQAIIDLVPSAFALDTERLRAEAWCWEELADTAINGFVVAARWADDRNWPKVRDEYFADAPWLVRKLIAPRIRARVVGGLHARDVWRGGADACWARFDTLLDQLESRAPENGFWLGKLSVADVAIFAQLHSLRNDLTEPQRDRIAAHPRLSSWLDRVDLATRGVRAPRLLTSVAA